MHHSLRTRARTYIVTQVRPDHRARGHGGREGQGHGGREGVRGHGGREGRPTASSELENQGGAAVEGE